MINNHSNYKQNSIVNRGSQITLILFLIVSVILSLVEYQESTITLGKFGELIYTALITNSGLLLFALFPLLITRIVIVIKFLKKQKESKWIIELLYILFILLLIPLKYHNLLNALPLEYFFTFLEPSILNSIFYFAFIANITDLIFLFSLTLNDVYSKNYKIEIKNRNFKYTIIIIFSILALFYYFKI